jgi:hypothetical protein
VTVRTSTHTSARKLGASNQIRNLNLLLSNALLVARAHTVGPALFVVIRDILFYLLHSARTTHCTHGHQTLFFLRLEGVASETRDTPRLTDRLLEFLAWLSMQYGGVSPSSLLSVAIPDDQPMSVKAAISRQWIWL